MKARKTRPAVPRAPRAPRATRQPRVPLSSPVERASLEYLKQEATFAETASGLGERGGAPRGASERWTSEIVVVRMTVK